MRENSERVAATIKAKYYFGAPVTQAKVKYKVLRTSHSDTWYPRGVWDWFYGKGYWWFACDYAWYPGWFEWGCRRPFPIWWHRQNDPPEVVLRVSVRDSRKAIVERFGRELAPMVTSGPPGVTGYTTGRPTVREVFAYWPALIDRAVVPAGVTLL